MPSDNEFTPLEDALTRAGRERAYPPTPHIAARVRATLQAEPSRPSILAPRRFGLLAGFASAAAVLLLAAVGTIIVRDQLAATASPPRGKAYIANLLGGDLSVIALQNDSVERSIAVGKNPWGLAISPDGRRVYSAVDEGVAVVDTARGQRVDFVPTGFTLAKLGLSADGRTLLVSSPGGQMKLIDLPTQGTLDEFTLGINPYDIKVEPTGRFAYVLGHGDGSLAVVDVRAGKVIDRLLSGASYTAYFMTLSPDGLWLYVPRLGNGELWAIDTRTNVVRRIALERKPYWEGTPERGLVVSPDGLRLYIATQGDTTGGVSVLDTQNFNEVARVNLGGGFFGAALSPDGTQLLLTDPDGNTLTILSADTLKLITSVHVGSSPFRVVAGP